MFLINGKASDCLPVTDRGLQYGDGVFETLAVSEQQPLCWDRHYQRLARGCQRLDIIPPTEEQLTREAGQLSFDEDPAVLKIIVTRGSGGRGYRPPQPPPPATRILSRHDLPDYPASHATAGIDVQICETRLGRNPVLAGIKHLNRLEQVLARNEWQDAGIAEGLMLDTEGCLVGGTISNLFIVRDNRLLTPTLDHCGIEGIVRQAVLETAEQLSLPCSIATLQQSDLQTADAVFVTNSIFGLWPVRRIDNIHFTDHSVAHRIRDVLISDRIILP